MELLNQILKEKKLKGFSWNKLAENLPINGDSLRIAFARKSVDDTYLSVICEMLDIRQNEHLTIEEPEIEFNPSEINNNNGSSFIDIGNGLYIQKIPLLEISAQAGFVDNYQDLDFLASVTDFHTIITNEVHRGNYLAFRVRGDSMDSGKSDAILPNYIVTGRELKREHWTSKLRINDYPYWIIGTTESSYPLLKKIVSHDVEKGIIKCHSLNDAPEYTDFELSLNDVTVLFYVVDVNWGVGDKNYFKIR